MLLDGPYFDLVGGFVYVNGIPHDIDSFNKLAAHFHMYPMYDATGNLIHNEVGIVFKTRLLSTSRNLVLGERFDSRTYLLPSGRKVQVKTVCEMEFAPKRKV
jgi:hypothetical protein